MDNYSFLSKLETQFTTFEVFKTFSISDLLITTPLEIIFFVLFFLSLKYASKSIYLLVIDLASLIVNLCVLITIIISNLDLSIYQKGWGLAYFTGISYLILPWVVYWFVKNYENYLQEPTKLKISRFQLVSLIIALIVAIIPIFFNDLITVYNSNTTIPGNLWNWDYAWWIEVIEFVLWIIFLVLFVVTVDGLNRKKLPDIDHKIISNINISAIIVFITPVFFVISSGFILISLLAYIISYYFVYLAIRKTSKVQG